ncbi:copper resistance CopC family protein [Saccharothrix australiensis]|uniref:CopC domain-containing protein n=1 Tax=Saccharothrix australiensis TaxID=2072 RepID=A0A495VYP7_9PSEU|nr:copper resistance protein CopC [Saccharothrix australiensis]RKT53950.1 hypothetical protein C8E97_2538 [Saccharothrix australiensis]
MKRLALSALVAACALLGTMPPAYAHTELVAGDPADGASLTGPPTTLTLTFTDPVPAESAIVTVTAPDGTRWRTGEITASGATLTVPVAPDAAPPGRYALAWQVVGLDGHYVDGATTFTLTGPTAVPPTPALAPGTPTTAPEGTSTPPTAPASAAPTSAAPTSAASTATTTGPELSTFSGFATAAPTTGGTGGGSGPSAWVWITSALLLLVAGVVVAVLLKRRRPDGTPPGGTPPNGTPPNGTG